MGETQLLATAMALCSDAELNEAGDAEGEPTESALVNYAKSLGMPKDELKKKMSDGEITSKTKWFFIQIAMGIPLVNLILLFVLAFKKEKTNLTIRNWAKANLIIVLVTTILTIALTLVIYFFFLEAFMTFIESAK